MGKKSEMAQLSLGLQTQAAGERLFEEIHALSRLELASLAVCDSLFSEPSFTRISATAALLPLSRQDIAPYLNRQVSRAGLERDIIEPAAIDLLAEASQGNPRTLNLLAQAAWLAAARSGATTIHPDHIHIALRQVPAATAPTTHR